MNFKEDNGFTLLEIFLIIAVIGIFAGIVILIINPNQKRADIRDAQRRSDVNAILNAVYEYSLDTDGIIPGNMSTTATEICATGANSCTGLIDLSVLTNGAVYLTTIPKDPNAACNVNGVCYEVSKSSDGRITVSAPDAETSTIFVTR